MVEDCPLEWLGNWVFSPSPGNTRHTSRPTKKVLEDDKVGYYGERDEKYVFDNLEGKEKAIII